MKKPKSVIIQGHTYKILSDNSKECKENLENEKLRGCVNYVKQVISIEPDQHDESWVMTLCHEIVHCFLQHFNYKHNEKLTDNLATAIFTFLSENKLWGSKK